MYAHRLSAIVFVTFAAPLVFSAPQAGLPAAAQTKIDFARDILPIFKGKCYGCHGRAVQTSGLRLDDKAAAMGGGNSGVVINVGDSAGSKLIQLVAGTDKLVMPPAGPKLSSEQIGLLRAWIDQGAEWPDSTSAPETAGKPKRSSHWAFQTIQRPRVPAVRARNSIRNSIDAFIVAKLEAEGIAPSPEAAKTTLMRRASLDLIGIPPSREEAAEFAADNRPDAYERLIDRLLASQHYGEKWARHWLDLARYADSDGYETDQLRPHAWRYRDWVVQALNRNIPYDRFTIEQVAGDLLPHATLEQKVATGFNRNTLSNREGGADPEEYRVEQVVDRTSTLGTVWLGLTVGCARCHDHKYDPISQREFYQLYGFFNSADEINLRAPLAGEAGQYLRTRPEYLKKRGEILGDLESKLATQQADWEKKVLDASVQTGKDFRWDRQWELLGLIWEGNKGGGQLEGRFILETVPAQRPREQKERLFEYFLRQGELIDAARFKELGIKDVVKKLDEMKKAYPEVTQAPTMFENSRPRSTHIHLRGDFRSPGIEVQAATPAVLPPLPGGVRNRLALARWLVSRENPLTARVAVNRLWQELFGAGIVLTSDDFGKQGAPPTHPELLDWLAAEYMDRGWDTKQMIRLIMTSATYRQSSKVRHDLEKRDPNNGLLARQSRLRIPAELIRDSALGASGLLSDKVGGPSVHPPQPESVTKQAFETPWVESVGPDLYRRGIYIWLQRTAPYAQLVNFDAPEPVRSCSRRERSDTPLQALNLLNDPVFFEAAQALAMRMLTESEPADPHRIRYGFQLCLARQPDAEEMAKLSRYLELQKSVLKKDPAAAPLMFPNRVEKVHPVEAAAWTGLASVLLNLDEFITRE